MPTYCYSPKDDSDRVEDHFFPIGQAPESVRLNDGRKGYRNLRAEMCGARIQMGKPLQPWERGRGYPRASEAMGVMPHQVGEAMAEDRKNGVRADYTKDGRPILTSWAHEKQYRKANGFIETGGTKRTEKKDW